MARVVPKLSCGVIDGPICTSRIRTAAIEFKLTHSSDLSEGRRTYQNSPFLLTPILQRVVGINCYQRSDAHCHLIPNTLDYEPYMQIIPSRHSKEAEFPNKIPTSQVARRPTTTPCVRQSLTTRPREIILQSKAMKSLPP